MSINISESIRFREAINQDKMMKTVSFRDTEVKLVVVEAESRSQHML